MKNKKYIIAGVGGFVAIVLTFWLLLGNNDDVASFAKCLTDNGVTMYGTDWCGHCSSQKELFGDDFKYINFVNCDFHNEECNEANVIYYPTWKSSDDFLGQVGFLTFEQLAELSGCTVPE